MRTAPRPATAGRRRCSAGAGGLLPGEHDARHLRQAAGQAAGAGQCRPNAAATLLHVRALHPQRPPALRGRRDRQRRPRRSTRCPRWAAQRSWAGARADTLSNLPAWSMPHRSLFRHCSHVSETSPSADRRPGRIQVQEFGLLAAAAGLALAAVGLLGLCAAVRWAPQLCACRWPPLPLMLERGGMYPRPFPTETQQIVTCSFP